MASRLVCQSRFESANRFTNHEGNTRADAIPVSSFFRKRRYSLRRALSLDSVDSKLTFIPKVAVLKQVGSFLLRQRLRIAVNIYGLCPFCVLPY